MWDIRITDVSSDKILEMFGRFRKDAQIICVQEGGIFDAGIAPHVHIYCVTSSSESWLRKQFQNLAINRKGNALYSMKKSHLNSPNYACKKIYEDTQQQEEILGHKRILFKQNCDLDLITTWKNQYVKYVDEIQAEQARSRSMRKKSSNNFSQLIVKELVTYFEGVNGRPTPHEIIPHVLRIYNENDKKLPTRNVMEIIILTIQMKLGQVMEVQAYYGKNFSGY